MLLWIKCHGGGGDWDPEPKIVCEQEFLRGFNSRRDELLVPVWFSATTFTRTDKNEIWSQTHSYHIPQVRS